MRHFSSYGPVDPDLHFYVPRTALVEQCVAQLVGDLDKGGHYFTVWAPRQTGKTWLLHRAMDVIRARHGDTFLVGAMSMQRVRLEDSAEDARFFEHIPDLFFDTFGLDIPVPGKWSDFMRLFHRQKGVFDRPVVLLIDEFDSLPRRVIDEALSGEEEVDGVRVVTVAIPWG